jgi:carbonic anhydrase/acetyltransferase-like protein (isoleucine patch superfamily)
MLHPLKGKFPSVGEGTFLAPSAEIIGDVIIGKNANA